MGIGKSKKHSYTSPAIIHRNQCLGKQLLDEIKLTLIYSHEEMKNAVYLNFDFNNWCPDQDSGLLISKDVKSEDLAYLIKK